DAANKGEAREITVSVGGSALSGESARGHGGAVGLTNTGFVHTLGQGSHAFFGQSIGGGGGNGGAGADANLNLGGQGGAGGDGGAVTFVNEGDILTEGDLAHGVFLQSIGGGGGTGGAAGGPEETDPSDEDLINSGIGLVTLPGDFVQAAEPADGGPDMTVSVGGTGGASGDGGDIAFDNEGRIATLGGGAHGLFAQSIGGGGGVGGNAGGGTLNVGGQGGATGDGGDIDIVNRGLISTEGAQATGIFAQSVGGGGGVGGAVGIGSSDLPGLGSDGVRGVISDAFATAQGLPSIIATATALSGPYRPNSVSVGGFGSAGGDGGDIAVVNSGSIVTRGTLSYGIFAQSVGGGGGMGGAGSLTPTDFAIPGGGGMGGDGGDVSVTQTGDI